MENENAAAEECDLSACASASECSNKTSSSSSSRMLRWGEGITRKLFVDKFSIVAAVKAARKKGDKSDKGDATRAAVKMETKGEPASCNSSETIVQSSASNAAASTCPSSPPDEGPQIVNVDNPLGPPLNCTPAPKLQTHSLSDNDCGKMTPVEAVPSSAFDRVVGSQRRLPHFDEDREPAPVRILVVGKTGEPVTGADDDGGNGESSTAAGSRDDITPTAQPTPVKIHNGNRNNATYDVRRVTFVDDDRDVDNSVLEFRRPPDHKPSTGERPTDEDDRDVSNTDRPSDDKQPTGESRPMKLRQVEPMEQSGGENPQPEHSVENVERAAEVDASSTEEQGGRGEAADGPSSVAPEPTTSNNEPSASLTSPPPIEEWPEYIARERLMSELFRVKNVIYWLDTAAYKHRNGDVNIAKIAAEELVLFHADKRRIKTELKKLDQKIRQRKRAVEEGTADQLTWSGILPKTSRKDGSKRSKSPPPHEKPAGDATDNAALGSDDDGDDGEGGEDGEGGCGGSDAARAPEEKDEFEIRAPRTSIIENYLRSMNDDEHSLHSNKAFVAWFTLRKIGRSVRGFFGVDE